MNSPPVSRQSSTPDGCRVLALAAVTYQDIPRSRHGERSMGRKPLTPAQRERRRASQKRWEEKHREERRAWRDDHREHRIAYFKRWRAENLDHIKRRLRDRAEKESKPEAAE
jgi:hypothetical protein